MQDDKSTDEKIGAICEVCRKFPITRHHDQAVCNHCYGRKLNPSPKRDRTIELLAELCPDGKTGAGVLTQIGREVGLSRERIRQIAVELGYTPTRRSQMLARLTGCRYCGDVFDPHGSKRVYCCRVCRKKDWHRMKYEMRKCECGREFECPKASHKRLCSHACRNLYASQFHRPFTPIELDKVKAELGNPFTTAKVRQTYGLTLVGAYTRIRKLIRRGLIEKRRLAESRRILHYFWK